MLPIIAIVGRPNVGKSTLFNRLTRTRNAIVSNLAGLTRDRQYGTAQINDHVAIVVDTGGIGEVGSDIETAIAKQVDLALQEAQIILFLVDARQGLTTADQNIATQLRKLNKPIYLVTNKIDGLDTKLAVADFFSLGLGTPHPIAAEHGTGITELLAAITAKLPDSPSITKTNLKPGIKIAIVGRPNVGKSTLTNRMIGEERMIVENEPGTTRDSIYIDFDRHGKNYTLIDTAGIRRRSKITQAVEKFSIIKAMQAIEAANVVILLLDAKENITDQDLRLLGFILNAGKALVIAVNKWDDLAPLQREKIRSELDRRLTFVDFARIYYISALHGTRVGNLFSAIESAYQSATAEFTTPDITRILESAVAAHQPPLVGSRRIKLRYAHLGGHNPPIIVVHGNQTELVPEHYRKYLENYFRKVLKLEGTPIRIEFKTSQNPYAKK